MEVRHRKSMCPRAILFLATCWFGFPFATNAADVGQLNPAWLDQDKAVISRLKPLLPPTPNEISATEWIKQLDISNKIEDRDIGFGGRRYQFATLGGYATAWISLVAYRDEIAQVHIQLTASSSPPQVVRVIQQTWGSVGKKTERGVEYDYRSPEVSRKLLEAIAGQLGDSVDVTVPLKHRADLELLLDPIRPLTVGTHCGIAGIAPEGREAIDRLTSAKQLGLLGRILRSTNPEARVYAAMAMDQLGKSGMLVSSADAKAIETIGKLDITIQRCDGCFISVDTADSLLHGRGPNW